MIRDQEKLRTMWQQYGLALGPGGEPYCNYSNIKFILEKAPSMQGLFWGDPSGICVFTDCPENVLRLWTRKDDFDLTVRFQREFGLSRASIGSVATMVKVHARQKGFPESLIKAMQERDAPI